MKKPRRRPQSDSNLNLKLGLTKRLSGRIVSLNILIFSFFLGINASVTSLLIWKQALSSDQVGKTFEFFKDFLGTANDDNSQVVLEAYMISFLTDLFELGNEDFTAPKTLKEINKWRNSYYSAIIPLRDYYF